MKWKNVIFIGLLLTALSSSAGAQSSQAEYIVAIDTEYAPYEFVDAGGRVTGFTVELITEIGRQAGVTFRFVPMSWPEAVAGLENGTVDLVNMIQTADRAQRYELSEPHSQIEQAIFRTPSASISSLDSLSGYKVALQEHDIALEQLAGRTDFERIIVHSKEEGFLMLNAGKADAFLAAERPGIELLRVYQLQNVEIAAIALYPQPFGFAARKGNTALIALLNTHLQKLKTSGEYDALVEKWLLPMSVENSWLVRYQSQVTGAIALLVVLAAFFVIWILLLRRAVKKRTQSLQVSEERYRQLFENSPIGVYRTTPDGHILASNPALVRMLGFSSFEELSTRNLEEGESDATYSRELFKERIEREGRIIGLEAEWNKRDGTPIFVRENALLVRDESGAILYYDGTIEDITEHKQVEESMHASAARLNDAQRLAHIGNWELDLPANILTWSDEIYRIFEMEPQVFKATYEAFLEAIHPDDREMVNQAYTESLQNRIPYEIDHRLLMKDGRVKFVHESCESWFDRNGSPLRSIGTVQDITERRRAEDILRRRTEELAALQATVLDISSPHSLSELLNLIVERAANLLGASSGGLYLTEPQQRKVRCMVSYKTNGDYTGTLLDFGVGAAGYVAETGKPLIIDDYSKWDGRASVFEEKQPFQAVLSAPMLWQGRVSGVIDLLRDDTSKKFTQEELNLLLLFANHASVAVENARIFGLLNQELTERRQAENIVEARLRLVEFTAQHSLDELLQKTLDEVCVMTDSPIGFYHFVEPDQKTISLQAWSTRTVQEYCKAEGKGMHYSVDKAGVWVDCIYQKHAVIHNDYASLSHRKGLPEGHAELVRELVVPILREGLIVAVLGVGNKAQDYIEKDIDKVAYFADLAWEIAGRKRVEEQLAVYTGKLEEMVDERTRELRDAQEQLVRQEKLATLGQLAGSIGHELRNPLGVISNAIYFLKAAQPNADDKVKEYLQIMENEARASDKIITDLLDFTRIKSVDREAVSVSELIRQTLERFPVPPSVEVSVEIPEGLPQAFVDGHQIVQVLGNLIINACQAMAATDVVSAGGKLSLYSNVQNDMINITVKDNGMGISPENMKKLFEPLFTTRSRGIGLGLAVSRKLVEANGGRIEVESEPGKGSSFSVYLPIYGAAPFQVQDKESR